VETPEALRASIAAMARHVAPAGLLIVEPWITPAGFDPSHPTRPILVDQPGLQAVRMNDSRVEGGMSVMDFHYLIARRGQPIEHLVETHSLGLFTDDEYRAAFEGAGLQVEHDPVGLMGRGLWIGRRSATLEH
jgi:hypothetical protein